MHLQRSRVDDSLISYLEELSCLTLSEEEKIRMTKDLQKIIDSIARLSELDTEGVSECTHPFDKANVFRNDEVQPSFDRELILKNAPVRNEEFFAAPKTID